MLIIFGGLPGTGKTTIARALVLKLAAVYVRIDSLEQALLDSQAVTDMGAAGYFVGYALAADNLRLGLRVIADSVNPLTITREVWRNVAIETGVPFLEVEVVCSDAIEHRSRVESRTSDIAGLVLPSWQKVVQRKYEPWNKTHVVIDTAIISPEQAVETITQALATVAAQEYV